VAATDPRGERIREELTRMYAAAGLDAGDVSGAVTAYFIDPDRAFDAISKQYLAATTGAASRQTGFGTLSTAEAERIAGTGVSEQQATQTFSDLASMRELQADLPGFDQGVEREDLISAGFEDNAAAKSTVKRKQQTRAAVAQAGGGYAASGKGLTGLGTGQ
jgi:hypothetical protein